MTILFIITYYSIKLFNLIYLQISEYKISHVELWAFFQNFKSIFLFWRIVYIEIIRYSMTFKYQIIQLYIWGRELQRFDDLQKKHKTTNCTH